ncbi:hypothetical protein [Aquabacterium sp. OR-4]|uniref:hypothetical protein n=1 Tax=Aquabacterium sp. OR-4 TaxID=2978127 RepID=UPI0028C8F04A|nr:hypothetical protein [Aquabacterium sp. OR-4]MDT7837174.1 hypothetical protein [Aquabacterium sp. OR-4]
MNAPRNAFGVSPHWGAPPSARPSRTLGGRLVSASALLALGLLQACSQPTASGFFPLEAGHSWRYEQLSEWENNTQDKETVTLSTLGAESLPDHVPGSGKAWRRRSASGVDYWLRTDDTGIYRVATKTDLQAEPEADKPVRYVLKMPLAVGTSWQAPTTAYLLKRGAEFPPEIRHTHKPVLMTYQIAAVGEAVKTRAGEFSDCLRVQGTAVMKLFADPVVGFREMPLHSTEWYCKGVGLVKLERSEPTNNSTFLQGGKLVMELTEWQ